MEEILLVALIAFPIALIIGLSEKSKQDKLSIVSTENLNKIKPGMSIDEVNMIMQMSPVSVSKMLNTYFVQYHYGSSEGAWHVCMSFTLNGELIEITNISRV